MQRAVVLTTDLSDKEASKLLKPRETGKDSAREENDSRWFAEHDNRLIFFLHFHRSGGTALCELASLYSVVNDPYWYHHNFLPSCITTFCPRASLLALDPFEKYYLRFLILTRTATLPGMVQELSQTPICQVNERSTHTYARICTKWRCVLEHTVLRKLNALFPRMPRQI